MDSNPILTELWNLVSRSIQFYINQRKRSHISLLKRTQLILLNSCLWRWRLMILASANTNFHWKKKRIETSKKYLQIKIYKCCQICFFFLFVRERNTFMISTAWHIKPCNIQRFIEDTGDLFFGWGVFRQTGQRDPVTVNAWQGFCCLLRGKLCMIIKIK